MKKKIILLAIMFCFSSCVFRKIYKELPSESEYSRSHILPIFMDGTCNKPNTDSSKNSNIYKLKRLVNNEIPSYYIEGVGNDGKVLGMALGLGVSKRVRYTYEYLAMNYKPNDTIYLFGFSRGAYSCRILSNMIYVAGIPNLSKIESPHSRKKFIRKLYKTYIGNMNAAERKDKIANFIKKWNKKNSENQFQPNEFYHPNIEMMGLFDTVEALAAPDYCESDFAFPNRNHLNQVANINKVFHAVALDDNRAQIFTPILLTSEDVKQNSNCKDISKVVEEVWFSGSHSDIGGSSNKNQVIGNNTLNWMLSRSKPYNLFKTNKTYLENPNLEVNNMQNFWLWILLYKNKNRDISLYHEKTSNVIPKLKVHESVIKRLELGIIPEFKLSKKDTADWYDKYPFNKCFTKNGKKRFFNPECECLEIVYN